MTDEPLAQDSPEPTRPAVVPDASPPGGITTGSPGSTAVPAPAEAGAAAAMPPTAQPTPPPVAETAPAPSGAEPSPAPVAPPSGAEPPPAPAAPPSAAEPAPASAPLPKKRASIWRTLLVGLLVLLGAVSLDAANHAVWLNRTVQNTDAWVATVGPLAQNEAVTTAVSGVVVHQVVQAIDVSRLISNFVPGPVANLVAGPIVSNLETFASKYVNDFMQTDTFYNLWLNANRLAHEQVKNLLSHTDTSGNVSIDLTPVVQNVDAQLRQRGIDLFNGGNIPQGLGVLHLQGKTLGQILTVLQFLQAFAILLPILTLLLFAAAILFSRSRRRGFVVVGVVSAIALALEFVGWRLAKGQVLANFHNETNRAGADAAWGILLQGLYQQTVFLLVIALVVALVAWLAGPIGLAKWIRDQVRERFGDVRGAGARRDTPLARFLRQWRRQLEIGAIVLAIVLLVLLPDISPLSVVVVTLAVVIAVIGIEVLAGPAEDLAESEDQVAS